MEEDEGEQGDEDETDKGDTNNSKAVQSPTPSCPESHDGYKARSSSPLQPPSQDAEGALNLTTSGSSSKAICTPLSTPLPLTCPTTSIAPTPISQSERELFHPIASLLTLRDGMRQALQTRTMDVWTASL